MVPAVAVNVAVVFPLPTTTVAGTLKVPMLLDSPTAAPPAVDTVTAQVELAFGPRLVGAQLSAVTVAGTTNEIAAVLVLPFNVAMMVAV